MSAVDVEDVGEAVLQHPSDGVVIGQIVMLLKVSVLVEVNGREVGGEHVQVDGLAVVLRRRGDVLLQTVQQQGACRACQRHVSSGSKGQGDKSTESQTQKSSQRRWSKKCLAKTSQNEDKGTETLGLTPLSFFFPSLVKLASTMLD